MFLPEHTSEEPQRRPCLCPGDCPARSVGRRMTGETCRTRSWTCPRWWRGSPPGCSLTPRMISPARTLISCLHSQPLTGILPLFHRSCQQPLLDFEPDGKRGYLYSKFLWTRLLSFSATYIYTWLNIANSWPIICFQPVAAVLRRLFSTFFGNRDQIVSTYLLFWHRKINSRG